MILSTILPPLLLSSIELDRSISLWEVFSLVGIIASWLIREYFTNKEERNKINTYIKKFEEDLRGNEAELKKIEQSSLNKEASFIQLIHNLEKGLTANELEIKHQVELLFSKIDHLNSNYRSQGTMISDLIKDLTDEVSKMRK